MRDPAQVGFRSNNFKLEALNMISTQSIPEKAARVLGPNCWKPEVCTSFTHRLLQFIKTNAEDEHRYTLRYLPREKQVTMEPSNKEGSILDPTLFTPSEGKQEQ